MSALKVAKTASLESKRKKKQLERIQWDFDLKKRTVIELSVSGCVHHLLHIASVSVNTFLAYQVHGD